MISPSKAIKIGVTKYQNEYEDAINVLWKNGKQITPTIKNSIIKIKKGLI